MKNNKANTFEMPNQRNASRIANILLFLIIIFGSWLRIEASIKTEVDRPLRSDALGYFSSAYNMKQYGVYSRDQSFLLEKKEGKPKPDAVSPPGYPLFLLPFASDAPTDKTILHITLTQAVLGILTILLTFITASQFMGRTWALAPSLLVAISPHLVNSGVYVLTESLFTFLMMATITCLAIQINKPENRWLPVAFGLLLGAAALTRPTLNYILPFLLAALLPFFGKELRWKWALGVIAGYAIIMAPWSTRNWLNLDNQSSTLIISTLVHGHYPGAMYKWDPQTLGYPYRFDPEIAQLTTSVSAALQGIMARASAEPITYAIWYLIGKPLMFLSWDDVASTGEFFTYPTTVSPYHSAPLFLASKYVMWATHYIWLILAVLAVFATANRWKDAAQDRKLLIPLLLSVFFTYFILVHIAGFPIARYSVPLLPVIFILAAYSLLIMQNEYKQRLSLIKNKAPHTEPNVKLQNTNGLMKAGRHFFATP